MSLTISRSQGILQTTVLTNQIVNLWYTKATSKEHTNKNVLVRL